MIVTIQTTLSTINGMIHILKSQLGLSVGHLHIYLLTPSIHSNGSTHGELKHSSIFSSQYTPIQPGLHIQS